MIYSFLGIPPSAPSSNPILLLMYPISVLFLPKNLLSLCPSSLMEAIHPSNPGRQVWINSHNKEKHGISDHDGYKRISKKKYLALNQYGKIPKAIPSMCVLIVKPDKDGKLYRANSCIVVLGNFEDSVYQKMHQYVNQPSIIQ